jgi:hypothetical protein
VSGLFATEGASETRRAKRLEAAIAVASLALLAWVVIRWYYPGHEIATIDYIPEYAPWQAVTKTFFSWSDIASPFGSFDAPAFTTYFLLYSFLSVLVGIGGSQIVIFWLFMAVMWIGAFVFCRSLGLGLLAATLAAWAYVFNPVAQFMPTFTTGSALASLLPWIFWMIYKGATDEKARGTITAFAAAVALLALPFLAATPQLLFELLLLTFAWAAFLYRRAAQGFLGWLWTSISLSVIAAGWWIVPLLFALVGNATTKSQQIADPSWSFANSSLLNNLRFIPEWFWVYPFYIPYANGYDHNVAVYAAGFWGIAVVCAGLTFVRGPRASLLRYLAAMTVVCLFLVKGLHPPLAQINEAIYKIPGFFLLIEPAGFQIAGVFAVCVSLGIVVQDAVENAATILGRARVALLSAGTLAAALLTASPLLNGLIFSGIPHNYVALPSYWREATSYINSAPGGGAVLVLPPDPQYQATYDWGYRAADGISVELVSRPVLQMGTSLGYVTDRRFEAIKRRIDSMLVVQDDNGRAMLKKLGIRFVLCRHDVAQSRPTFNGDYCFVKAVATHASVRHFGELDVYDLGAVDAPFTLNVTNEIVPQKTLLGFAHVLDIPADAVSAVLYDRQFFNNMWMAVKLWPPAPLLHDTVDWHNAWPVNGGGTVIVYNLVNLLEVVLLAFGALVVFGCTLYAARGRPS